MSVRKYCFCLAFVLCITIMIPAARGQEFRGKIQGLVTDPSNAVIPGATVTLLNIKTGIQTVKVTNETGLYRFDNVDPGSYTVTVEMAGFSKYVQENITVQAQADVTVNIPLKVGGSSETVTVTESPVAVSFNTTNIALTIDNKLTEDIPRLDRNPFKLSYLNPAVQDTRRQEVTRSCPGLLTASKWEAARTRRTIFRSMAAQSVPATKPVTYPIPTPSRK